MLSRSSGWVIGTVTRRHGYAAVQRRAVGRQQAAPPEPPRNPTPISECRRLVSCGCNRTTTGVAAAPIASGAPTSPTLSTKRPPALIRDSKSRRGKGDHGSRQASRCRGAESVCEVIGTRQRNTLHTNTPRWIRRTVHPARTGPVPSTPKPPTTRMAQVRVTASRERACNLRRVQHAEGTTTFRTVSAAAAPPSCRGLQATAT